MIPTLRPYQETAVAAIRAAFGGGRRRVLFVLPTGGGKTVIFSHIVAGAVGKGRRALIVAHRREIVRQISRSLGDLGVRHGMIAPGHTMTADPVQVGMIQTIARRLDEVTPPNLLIVDEAHHVVAGSWRKATVRFKPFGTKTLGVTATPERLDGRGLGEDFDVLVEGPQTHDLIALGNLASFTYLAPPAAADLTAVRTRMGDYAVDDLAKVMDRATVTGDAVGHYREHLAGRPAIAFCVTVDHARHVAEQFRSAGIRAACVDGSMEASARTRLIADLGCGSLDVLTSCELISEGVDVPVVAGAILLRPTKSLALFLQQIGRCLRPKPDGARAVILDHVGNVHRHGLPDAPRSWSLDSRKKRATPISPVRVCNVCFGTFAAGMKPDCDVEVCGLAAGEGPGRAAPRQVDGMLAEVSDRPAWAGGCSLTLARGAEWKALLVAAAGDEMRLREIAKARGFHHGWVRHQLGLPVLWRRRVA